ncbi:MAG: hypothetical protein ACREJC_16330 [Tepidisphaeraceae bacterium]
MKAQRRHELEMNSLAKSLETFPETAKRYAPTVLLMLAVFFAVYAIMKYRRNAATQRSALVTNSIAKARNGIATLRQIELFGAVPEQLAQQRNSLSQDIANAIDDVLRNAEGASEMTFRAEAILARGDLHWTLANLAPLPGATTQPMLLPPKSQEELLRLAEEGYNEVLAPAYSAQKESQISARFGLAAISENRHDFVLARKIYSEIRDSKDVPDVYRIQASFRIQLLPQFERPILLGAWPATAPATP